ncbi:MAG TPA: ferredoxin [Myxococcales bacterium]|jgi:2Fe-2S ferredoxin|nr:ferredoxin [Myxococcales bacterium]
MPKVTILPDGKTIELSPGSTLLEASNRAGAMHGAACGGVGACSTCHVRVLRGLDSLSEATEHELDMIDRAFDPKPDSRLGCQARLCGEEVVFEIAPESTNTWLDEHPAERREIEQGKLPAGVSDELKARLLKHVRR